MLWPGGDRYEVWQLRTRNVKADRQKQADVPRHVHICMNPKLLIYGLLIRQENWIFH